MAILKRWTNLMTDAGPDAKFPGNSASFKFKQKRIGSWWYKKY